jgi:hypothetical protein
MEHRYNPRVSCAAPARAEGPRGPLRGQCRSLSQGGLFFLGAQLPVGQRVELSVELPRLGRVEALGEVRYHYSTPEGQGMGVRFTRLGQESLALIQRFVAGARRPASPPNGQ